MTAIAAIPSDNVDLQQRPTAQRDLERLREKVRRDLDYLDYPNLDWVRPVRPPTKEHVYDVAIVGAGQGGLAVGFALYRERVRNTLIIDASPARAEGPWITFARMRTLRTPKYLTGPDLGIPDLTFRAWFDTSYAVPTWNELARIPTPLWMDYLNWFRDTVDLPTRNNLKVEEIEPLPSGLLRLRCTAKGTIETILARKVVMANGLEGSGRWYVPDDLVEGVPSHRYAHTAWPIDFSTLAGKRVAVLGVGASAVDNAAMALDQGAQSVDLFFRRSKLPRGERRHWLENNGFLRHFAELEDALKWRAIRYLCEVGTPPPPWSLERLRAFENCRFHPSEPWQAVAELGDSVRVTTAKAGYDFDFLIFGTGLAVDPDLRPELRPVAGKIATWEDRYQPPAGEECEPLGKYPYLGRGFELTEREPGTAPALKDIHIFNWGSTASMGVTGSSITGMKFGVSRLVAGITRDLYFDFAAEHVDEFPR